MVYGTLGPEAACTSGTPDFFTAILLPLLNKETSRLSVIGATFQGAASLGCAVTGLPPLLSPRAGAPPPLDLPRVSPVHASLLLAVGQVLLRLLA